MRGVDFGAPTGVYMHLRAAGGRQRRTASFRLFATLAEAIRFVVEELPQGVHSAYIKAGDERLEMEAIRRLYESDEYPLERRATRQGR
jgi:hypothetical protein